MHLHGKQRFLILCVKPFHDIPEIADEDIIARIVERRGILFTFRQLFFMMPDFFKGKIPLLFGHHPFGQINGHAFMFQNRC